MNNTSIHGQRLRPNPKVTKVTTGEVGREGGRERGGIQYMYLGKREGG